MDTQTTVTIVSTALGLVTGAVGAYVAIKIKLANGETRMGTHSDKIKKNDDKHQALEKRVVELEKDDAVQKMLLERVQQDVSEMKSSITSIHEKLDKAINKPA